ncbi:hypothetical protein M422DRAFT_265511 [Sphaerobolus stellatus SS14]|uniref:Uncharacterized protein n=1 Tax=Sphaerobolus stellatus (strain SS14) TaxID=990650 RepID=A0A0C9V546_SPHS4|nr:hypothetical protein M422DRAFT_265511 [Sphaerobolus stellatus SS14]
MPTIHAISLMLGAPYPMKMVVPGRLKSVKWVLVPGFHIPMLEPATINQFENHTPPAPDPIMIDDEENYELDAILDSKIDKRRKCKLQYLVK